MIISSCPLRVSLFGGSTDNPYFVEKYGRGSVISFASNLKTYITLHEDKLGYNIQGKKYIINYSKREETEVIEDIQNELVRIVLDYFGCCPLSISMLSDAYSQGSGLASSSSYIISLIKSICLYKEIDMSDNEICDLAFLLEQKMNPYCGYQDPYGCGVGGFKRIDFESNGNIKYNFLSTDFFKNYDAHLIFTGVTRNSKTVLKDVTSNIDKSLPLLEIVDEAHKALKDRNYEVVMKLMSESWEQKKNTSSLIVENQTIQQLDEELSNNDNVLSHKLCGAGNGGFFLTFSKPNTLKISQKSIRIDVESNGVIGKIL